MYWYVRSQNKITGPFPSGQIQQSILLGRVKLDDSVSKDKEEWTTIRRCPEIIPDILKEDPNAENHKERIKAAQRWADERRGERRLDEGPDRTGPGRREEEAYTTSEYRHQREAGASASQSRRDKSIIGLILVVALILIGVIAAFTIPPPVQEEAQCDSLAKPGVNWMNCQFIGLQSINSNLSEARLSNANLESANLLGSNLQKADLSYANLKNATLSYIELQDARLLGADLRGVNLSETNLTNADLSYVNLKGATLTNAILTNTILSNAIWVDGRKCLSPSIGSCQLQ